MAEPGFELVAAAASDGEALVALRIAAMQPSLERIGRFDAQRARDRFLGSFDPALTRWIIAGGQRAGFIVLRRHEGGLLLDHLYLHPRHQNQGLGTQVLQQVLREADAQGLALRVSALRESASNAFYQHHGFALVGSRPWDNHYLRQPAG